MGLTAGTWSRLQPASYTTEIIGVNTQNEGSFHFRAPKAGKYLLNFTMNFQSTYSNPTKTGIRITGSTLGTICEDFFSAGITSTEETITPMNLTKIKTLPANELITFHYYTQFPATYKSDKIHNYADITYLN